ncbi:hypothetical protein BCR35DRAFT_122306 [Leucosporidium creatinivorum]|uniref:Uncharacterized protein n=1 Tax=Leucosporidium creatinivorum TaxID=106004 RepID=A0A1Y2EZT9_9BASI|nr:hypothetical protein BCR35DRAFT_122306 [Leucosporidium creatinivorum]
MMLLGGDDLPSLSLEPKKRRSKPHQQYLSPPADDFTSGVIPVPHPLSPASTSSHSLTASPPHQPFAVPTGLPLGVAVPPSPSLSFNGDDDDISSAASTPPIGSFDAPPSPAIDFQAFSLAARQPSTTTSHSPFASTDAPPHVSSATRAEIAPWSITEEVGPFDISPRKGNGIAKGAKRTTAPSGAWSPPPSASSGMSRTSSSGKLGAAGEYLGVASQEGAPRRKSSGGFGLFGRGDSSHSHEEGHESPGKEGSRWGFLRRGSRA